MAPRLVVCMVTFEQCVDMQQGLSMNKCANPSLSLHLFPHYGRASRSYNRASGLTSNVQQYDVVLHHGQRQGLGLPRVKNNKKGEASAETKQTYILIMPLYNKIAVQALSE